jgi:sphingomyelin phosphodiesterase acid-like 3
MISTPRLLSRPSILGLIVLTCFHAGFLSTPAAQSQQVRPAPAAKPQTASSAEAEKGTVPALFISDIHFDPFHDPAKAKQLAATPVAQWRSILSSSPSADQEQAFAGLQQSCHAKGVDTPIALFRSSLAAMHTRQPDAKFITVSGDLIAHAFTCRYATLFPDAAPGDYQAFVLKTMSFVMDELRHEFPGVPVYMALGNNDSGCGDYQLDAGSDFVAQAGKIIAQGLPPSQQPRAISESAAGTYYSVTMAEPMRDTRLIVVNDLFLSPKYTTCGGKHDTSGASEEMAWLEQQLQDARRSGQRVWIMGHIPPGVDPFSTVTKFRDVCGGQSPVEFLASDRMADLMVAYADVVRLSIFGHTHMDEMRLLKPEGTDQRAAEGSGVAVKIVPSISPVDGNNPSFTVARVNPSTALLEDYDVIAASNQTGVATTWSVEYNFAKTYREPAFSSSTMNKLIGEFSADRNVGTAPSQAYIRDYFVGDMSRALTPFWPEYVCAVNHYTAKGFAGCVCSSPR